MDLSKYIDRAKRNGFELWKLNFILGRGIPFNKPHGIKIHRIGDYSVSTIIPYKRKNFNHIKGIHACGLATCSEFASGFLLLTNLDVKVYRLIMEKIEMQYHYQAKSHCIAKAELSELWFNTEIIKPLQSADKISVTNTVNTYDSENNHICTAKVTWQIKNWNQVKTKV
ncbi:MAG: DUF4442 domain-containing protein [Putridiphycobacter sp.]|nr:DUF4442 domain-containing protein [Putridiphycobacter sp.]